MMQTCGAGSNWGSAGSSTGQVCILGKQASLVAACKRFIRPQVLDVSSQEAENVGVVPVPAMCLGGPCRCDCLYLEDVSFVRAHHYQNNSRR